MLNVVIVHQQAREIAGMTYEEAHSILPFCETAVAVIDEKIRLGADESDVRHIMAAASLALSKYYSARFAAEGDIGSFKAGDVTISYDGSERIKTIENLKKSAFADAHDLLTDDGFIFESI